MVGIFARKSRTRWTLGSHQIRVFRRRLEQLAGQEARREHREASVHSLEVRAPPEEDLDAVEACSNHTDVADPVRTICVTASKMSSLCRSVSPSSQAGGHGPRVALFGQVEPR
jgi:hypothetical protein